ncbi:MAG: porin [Myxococcota bacterium]
MVRFALLNCVVLASAGVLLRVAPAWAQVNEPADDAEIPAAAEPAPSDAKPSTETPPASTTAPAPATAPAPPKSEAPASAPVTAVPAPTLDQAPRPAEASKEKAADKPAPAVDIGGYLQAEYQSHQDSEDQLRQGGGVLNQNRFLVRRARLMLRRAWEYTSLEAELDGNTNSGPSIGFYRAEASLFYRGSNEKKQPPLAQLTVGMFKVPFGFELPESSSQRWFTERTQLSRALWPSEIDVGARLSGAISAFRYAFAVTNGEPLGSKSGFALQDPNRNKDFTLSAGAVAQILPMLRISGGVSAVTGRGFHAGTSVTKPSVTWRDVNDNGMVDNGELIGVAAQAETPSKSFDRFAVGGDLQLYVKTPLGETMLYAEMVTAKNLDRGFFVADPIAPPGVDLREFGWYVGVLQPITEYGMIGFRAEYYDPNADSSEQRASRILPLKNTVRTYSPLVGLSIPGRARLLFQYDIIRDHLARDTLGVPTDLKNDAWTLRLQVHL